MQVVELLSPVPGTAPCGRDSRYEPEHVALRDLIRQEQSVHGVQPDWEWVDRHGQQILRDQSKDLVIATYVAAAQVELRGVNGLCDGMLLIEGLLQRYWNGLFPVVARRRARVQGLQWFVGRVERWLAVGAARGLTITKGEVERALATSERLAVALAAVALDAEVSLRAIDSALSAYVPAVPDPVECDEANEEVTAAEPAVAAGTVGGDLAPAPRKAAAEAPRELFVRDVAAPNLLTVTERHLLELGRELRREVPDATVGYAVFRVGLEVSMRPLSSAESGRTEVPAPSEAFRRQLTTLKRNARWEALLDESESALGRFRYWLDLHRYSAEALERLDRSAASAIVTSRARCVSRVFPNLARQCFADGTPFAAPETQTWLDEKQAPSGSDAPAPPPLNGGGAALSARDAFCHRLEVALSQMRAGDRELARIVFAGLHEEATTRRVSEWEPKLIETVLFGYLESLSGDTSGEATALRRRLAEQLCAIAPEAAPRVAEVGSLGVGAIQ